MTKQDYFEKLAILIPSRVTTEERHNFSSASIKSLKNCLNKSKVSQIVVHDRPGVAKYLPKMLYGLSKSIFWDSKARETYESPETIWLEGKSKGSAHALLVAVMKAIFEGKEYGFIHLDDHVYTNDFGHLLSMGLRAMEQHPDLLWTRFSGYPLIYNNKAELNVNDNGQITFDGVTLTRHPNSDFTVWSTPLNREVNEGNYWPIAMWFSIYRLEFLKTILEWALNKSTKHLAHVEVFYKGNKNFQKILDRYPDSSFAYINMQFGGIEMHRNKNWKDLLMLENYPIR